MSLSREDQLAIAASVIEAMDYPYTPEHVMRALNEGRSLQSVLDEETNIMSDTTPKRTVPAEVEKVLTAFAEASFRFGQSSKSQHDCTAFSAAFNQALAAILAALEPERALRERAERLRLELTWWLNPKNMTETYLPERFLKEGDLADDLAATSSAEDA